MNRILLTLFAALFSITAANSQNLIKLQINHKQGNSAFALNSESSNNMGNPYNLKRVQYYLSSFEIVHDGGNTTTLDSTWMLVNATQNTLQELGTFNINTVEAIKFSIGVENEFNHGDPALFSIAHPLGPKSPSMHWGWASGYRFIAVEGYGGSSLNQLFELHGLGDKNYVSTEVLVDYSASNGEIVIDIDADYDRVLEDIDVSGGKIVHGEDGDAQAAIMNFKNFVFSEATGIVNPSSISENGLESTYLISPNPSNGNIRVISNVKSTQNSSVQIVDVLGKTVFKQSMVNSNQDISLPSNLKGLFFVQFINDSRVIETQKLILK